MKKLLSTIAILISVITLFGQELKEKKDYDILPAYINSYGQPIIELEVNGVKGYFLYDTGASVTMVNYYELKEYSIELSTGTNNVNGLGGDNSITHLTKGVGFSLSHKKIVYLDNGIYSKDLSKMTKQLSKGLDERKVVGILGMDLIKRLGISFNAINRTFVVYGGTNGKKRTELLSNHFIETTGNSIEQ